MKQLILDKTRLNGHQTVPLSAYILTPQLYVLSKYQGRSKHLETGPDTSTVKLHPLIT